MRYWPPKAIPLINIRWLLHTKVAQNVLAPHTAAVALDVARDMHFRSRQPSALQRRWLRELPQPVADLLARELTADRREAWDRKRLDAVEAVQAVLVAVDTDEDM